MKMQIHQMLHGYNLGHNFIQGSIILPLSTDMDSIVTLSDWSEYINQYDENDYITAYPLVDSEFYVIAKTWYANEMKRPGCVWTHSFLISFNQLSLITDFRIFIKMFHRPENHDFDFYSQPIQIDSEIEYNAPMFAGKVNIPALPLIYRGLIGNKEPMIYGIENRSNFYQYLCLLLMNYFPFSLLNKISFSSGSSSVRSLNKNLLSLQFITQQNSFVNSIIELNAVEMESIPSYIRMASLLIASEQIQLSRLIHTFAENIENSEQMEGFLFLIELLNKKCDTTEEKYQNLKLIIAELAACYPQKQDGIQLKERFLQQKLTSMFMPDHEFFYEISINKFTASFDWEYIDFWPRFECVAKSDTRHFYIHLLKNLCNAPSLNDWGKSILARTSEFLTLNDIKEIINVDWSFYKLLVSVCPELLNQDVWMTLPKTYIEDILQTILNDQILESFTLWSDLLTVILRTHIDVNKELANLIFQKNDDYIIQVLDYMNESQENTIPPVISGLCRKENLKILDWMETVNEITPKVGNIIMTSNSAMSKQIRVKGSSRWVAFSNLSQKNMPLNYYSYLYLLSFNWMQDINAILFMQKSFYPLYKAAESGILEYELWKSISPYTEELPIWLDWDRCKKLKKAVVKRVKDAGLPKSYIRSFTLDQELNKELAKIWDK